MLVTSSATFGHGSILRLPKTSFVRATCTITMPICLVRSCCSTPTETLGCEDIGVGDDGVVVVAEHVNTASNMDIAPLASISAFFLRVLQLLSDVCVLLWSRI